MPPLASSGIRIATVWLAMTAIWLLLGAMRRAVWGTGYAGYTLEGHIASAAGATLLVIPMVYAARRWLDGGTFAGLGLPVTRAAWRPLLAGLASYAGPAAVAAGVFIGMGWAGVEATAPIGEIALFLPLLLLLVFFFEALPEELVFRGYILTNLLAKVPPVVAVLVQAALFALWGAAIWTLSTGTLAPGRFALFLVAGTVLGTLRVATGSVWTSIGFHLGFQTAAQLVFNVERGHFAITNGDPLQVVALGLVPFALAPSIARIIYTSPAPDGARRVGH